MQPKVLSVTFTHRRRLGDLVGKELAVAHNGAPVEIKDCFASNFFDGGVDDMASWRQFWGAPRGFFWLGGGRSER